MLMGLKNKSSKIFGTFSCKMWNVNGICASEIASGCAGLMIIVRLVNELGCCDARVMELLTLEHVCN
jgi:hypothetical protein